MSVEGSPTCVCHKPVLDGYLCHEDTAQLARNLQHLAEIVPALTEVAAVGRGGGIPEFTVSRKWVPEDKPLPVNMAAVQAVRHCYDVGVVMGHALVAGFVEPAPERRKIVGLLGYASQHADLARREPDAVQLYDDVADVVEECAKVLDRAEEKRQSQAATDARNLEAFDKPMRIADAVDWLRIYKGRSISKRTVQQWMKDGLLPERRNDRGEHEVIPSTVLEEADRPKRGRRTTAA